MTVTHAVLERTDHGRFGDHELPAIEPETENIHRALATRYALFCTNSAIIGVPKFACLISTGYAIDSNVIDGFAGPVSSAPDDDLESFAEVPLHRALMWRNALERGGYIRRHPGVGWELPYHEDMRRRWQQEAHDRSPESRLRIPTHVDANVDQWVSLHLPAGFRPTFTGGAHCRTCGQNAPDGGDTYVVYRDGHVKIGVSSNVSRRVKALRAKPGAEAHPQCMDPYQPLLGLGVIPGNVEHALHEHFIEHYAAGEWFRLDGELLQWLNEHAGASDPGPREEEPEWETHVAVAPV